MELNSISRLFSLWTRVRTVPASSEGSPVDSNMGELWSEMRD